MLKARMRIQDALLVAGTTAAFVLGAGTGRADEPTTESRPTYKPTASDDFARKIDEYIDKKLAEEKIEAAPPADDAEFLRRVFLDTIGETPAPGKVMSFLADRDPDKRRKVVDELLQMPEAARNWAER